MNRRSLRAVAAAVLLGSLPALPALSASPEAPGTGQTATRFEGTVQRTVSVPYLIFRPAGYDRQATHRWPLLLFLHGAGERGTNLDQVTVHGPPKLVKQRPDFPFVVVSPQCPPDTTWDIPALDLLLSHLLETEAVDPARVCLTGLSMGGYGTWAWISARPERFAAAVPICGGGDPVRVWLAGGPLKKELARLPVWAFHGAKDTVVPLSASEAMVDAFRRVGNQPRLTVDPNAGHDSWTAAYQDPALLEWLLRQRRP